MSDLSTMSSTTTLTMSSFSRSSLRHSQSDSALDLLSERKSSQEKDFSLFEDDNYERLTTDLRIMFKNFTKAQDKKLLLMLDIITEMRDKSKAKQEEELSIREKYEDMKQRVEAMEKERKEKKSLVQSLENRVDQMERMTLAAFSELRKMKRKSVMESIEAKHMGTDDSMSDDVFEDETLRAPAQRNAPSPTGYRDYQPPESTPSRLQYEDDMPLHKTILLGDSGVGKTSLLVQFETGKFQSGNFSATVGIGFTVMLLGDSGVGKTCMLVRFRDGHFLAGNYVSTVGIDFRVQDAIATHAIYPQNKVVTVDGMKVKLQIWDTAGQERFRSVTHAYYRDAHALLLLYDVTNKISFDNIRAWLGEIREYAQDDVVIMLLGNKSDSGLERAVKREEGMRLAREYQVAFMETSAKTGLNVEAAFAHVARSLVAKANPADPSRLAVRAQPTEEPHTSSCPQCS